MSLGGTVDRNARLFVHYTACGGTGEVRLLRDGEPVDATIEYGAAILPSVFANVRPKGTLEPGPYVLEVKRDAYEQETLSFTVADEDAVSEEQVPSIDVTSAAWTSAANRAGLASATFELKLATSTPGRGGVYYVDRTSARDLAWSVTSTAVVVDEGEASASASTSWAVRAGEQVCFRLTYEDATGKLTDAAAPACTVVSGEAPAEEPNAEAASSRGEGCSASPSRASSAVAPTLLALGACVATLRRRRGSSARATRKARLRV